MHWSKKSHNKNSTYDNKTHVKQYVEQGHNNYPASYYEKCIAHNEKYVVHDKTCELRSQIYMLHNKLSTGHIITKAL